MANTSQFYEDLTQFKQERRQAGLSAGPCYGDHPLVWFDQLFGAGFAPAGEIDLPRPLRVGATQNALDALVVANPKNAGNISIAANATITLTLSQGDSAGGDFEQVGPTICYKAGPKGMEAEPGALVARFAIGNFDKPWLKVSLAFEGAITGGLVDCALGYVPR